MDNQQFTVEWVDRQREPKRPPNPDFPNGIDVDMSIGSPHNCTVQLPYPAQRCGIYRIKCAVCGVTAACTTAGRNDDPKSLKLRCLSSKGVV